MSIARLTNWVAAVALPATLLSGVSHAANYTVTNLNNVGAGSLRQAVVDANENAGADTIQFAVTGKLAIINTIMITDELELTGPGADQLTISSIGTTLLQVNAGATVTIAKLKLTDGYNGIDNRGTLTVNNCTISGNQSSGIVDADNATLVVNNSTISGNTASDWRGSGIYNGSGKATVNKSIISSNASSGISNRSGNLIVNNSIISSNTGNGMSNISGNLTVNNSTISGNTYSGIDSYSGTTTVSNSTISSNRGGGITTSFDIAFESETGKLTVISSTISGNSYSGIFDNGGRVTINVNNTTISGNSGYGIYANTLSIGNSIVAGNVDYGYEIETNSSSFVSLGYNLFGQNHNSGVQNGTLADTDIVLVGDITTAILPLADNGGPTQTHLLTPTSQALDAGSKKLIPAEITTDQRGAPRIENGIVDIGAVEGTTAFIPAATVALSIKKTGNGSVTSAPAGIDCGSVCSAAFAINTAIKLTATADTGYTFSGWSGGGCSGNDTCTVTMKTAQTITATFIAAPVNYNLSVNRVGDGTITSDPTGINCGTGTNCTAKYASGKTVTLTAAPAAGFTFVNWTGCTPLTTNALQCQFTMTVNKNVTATFAAIPNSDVLTIKTVGHGTVTSADKTIHCGGTSSACIANYSSAAAVILTATPASDYAFTHWNGCTAAASTPNQCRVNVSGNKTVTATFSNTTTLATDVRVTAITLSPAMPIVNKPFSARITIKNVGRKAMNVGAVDVWLDNKDWQPCGALGDAFDVIGLLEPGASQTITVNLTATTTGSKRLHVFADSQCATAELHEGNNQVIKRYTVK